MKKVLVLFIVGVLFFGACSAQNANAQNANIGQRIIGTWVDQIGITWVFNANGNLTRTYQGDTAESKFAVTDTKLAFTMQGGMTYILNISMSSDGRTLILEGANYHNGDRRETLGYWLTKR